MPPVYVFLHVLFLLLSSLVLVLFMAQVAHQGESMGSDYIGRDSLVYEITLPQKYGDRHFTAEASMYFQAIPPN